MWPFRRNSGPPAYTERLESLEEASRVHAAGLNELGEQLDYLRLEVRRLRGTVTGGKRLEPAGEPASTVDQISERIRTMGRP